MLKAWKVGCEIAEEQSDEEIHTSLCSERKIFDEQRESRKFTVKNYPLSILVLGLA